MSISFRTFYYKKDIYMQRYLFKECFPETKGTIQGSEEFYNWFLHSFPAEKKSYEYGAYFEDQLVGYYSAVPYKYLYDKQELKAGLVSGVMTASNMRGKGIFSKLGKYSTDQLKDEGLDFSTGYPIRTEVIPGHLKVGWEIYFDLPIFIKFLKFNSVLAQKNLKILKPLLHCLNWLYQTLLQIFQKRKVDLNVEMYDSFERIDINKYKAFKKKWENESEIVLNKSPEFIKWRTGAPESEYTFMTLMHKEEIIGLAITRITTLEDISNLVILDLIVLKDHIKGIDFLFYQINKIALEKKVEAISLMISKYWAKNYRLQLNGFIRSPYKFQLIIKRFSNKVSEKIMKVEKNWHLMWIDTDNL